MAIKKAPANYLDEGYQIRRYIKSCNDFIKTVLSPYLS